MAGVPDLLYDLAPVFLARFLDGQDPALFWEAQYWPFTQIPAETLKCAYSRSPAHARANGWMPEQGRVLDAGCGPGVLALMNDRPERRVVGVDCSPSLIRLAERFNPGAELALGTLESLPFPNDGFDAYVAISSFEFSRTGLAPAFREAHRVLRPGGKLLAICLRIPLEAHLLGVDIVESTSGRFRLEPISSIPNVYPADGYGFYYRTRELVRAAEDAGFVGVRTSRSDLIGGLCYSQLAGKHLRKPLLEWVHRHMTNKSDARHVRIARDVLLREGGLVFLPFAPAIRVLRSAWSYWNVIEAAKCASG